MTGGLVGGELMPRPNLSTSLVALLLAASSLAVTSTAAEAAWTRPGDLVKYRVCKANDPGSDVWVFRSRVRKHFRTPDARASFSAYSGNQRVALWRTGWLDRGEVEVALVRVRKSSGVRVYISQEAGDRESSIGTSLEAVALKPGRVRRCG